MIRIIILTTLCLLTIPSFAQDSITFNGYKGFIPDSTRAPYGSEKIFYQQRFNLTKADVIKFEEDMIFLYAAACRDFDKKQLKGRARRLAIKNIPLRVQYQDNEHCNYDRNYYGCMINGKRYVVVYFKPHQERYWSADGGGEALLVNLFPLAYDLDHRKLYYAGKEE